MKDVTNSGTRQSLMARVLEQGRVELLVALEAVLPNVITQKLSRALHQRDCAGLASFSQETQLCRGSQSQISDGKIDQFLDPCSRVVEEAEQDRISSPPGRLKIRLRQNFRELLLGKVGDRGPSMPLLGNREDFLERKHVGGFLGLHISEEGMQSGQPMVSCLGRGVPACPQVIEECFHQSNIEMFKAEFFRWNSTHVPAESQKKREYIAIGFDGIGAEISLSTQVMCQKFGHVDGKICRLHCSVLRGMTSPKAASSRAVISGKSSAVRCK